MRASQGRPLPRRLTWQGTVLAEGLWFNPQMLGEAEARARVLAQWAPGAEVYRLGDGYLLRWPRPRRVRTSQSTGLAMCRVQGRLSSMPISDREWGALAPPIDAILLAHGGVVQITLPEEAQRVDLSQWVDLTGLQWVRGEPLGPMPPPLTAEDPRAFRDVVGISPSAAAAALNEALLVPETSAPPHRRSLRERLGGLLKRVGEWLGHEPPGPAEDRSGIARVSHQVGGWLDRVSERLNLSGALNRLLGAQPKRTLQSLLDRLERGEFESAIRDAIPLNPTPTPTSSPPPQRTGDVMLPQRRSPQLTAGGSGRSQRPLTAQLYELLKKRYRQAFEQLDQAGMVKQAAYVLCELLGEPEEAVDYLIRRGELHLAAELAEARKMPIPKVAILWLQAGETLKALFLLRLHGCFPEGIDVLMKTDPARAGWLRTTYAHTLARSGRFAAAADVMESADPQNLLVLKWLRAAIETGGATGARALVRWASRQDGVPEETLRPMLQPYLDAPGDLGDRIRSEMAVTLLTKPPETASPLGRPLLRRMLLDLAGRDRADADAARRLASHVDPVLAIDFPHSPRRRRRHQLLPTTHHIRANDAGARQLVDAHRLDNGQFVVALGEGGVLVLDRAGRTRHHFLIPTHHLVLSDTGAHAIAATRRGDLIEAHRLDLHQHRATSLTDGTRAEAFAASYDGDLWIIGARGHLLILDAQSREGTRLVGRVRLPSAEDVPIVSIARSRSAHLDVMTGKDPLFWHQYTLPGFELHNSVKIPSVEHVDPSSRVWPDGTQVLNAQDDTRVVADWRREGPVIKVRSKDVKAYLSILKLDGARRVRGRVRDNVLTVCDDRGRVHSVDLQDGKLLSALRV
ncbi:MAG: bpX6 domain-containing protein [Myxococcota bacterium]